MMDTGTPLQQELVSRIVQLVHEDGLQPGTMLNESRLAERLNVSRSPVRAALESLARGGFVERQQNRGVQLVAIPPVSSQAETSTTIDEILVRIARDRREGNLVEFTEAEAMRRYHVDRKAIRAALSKLEEIGAIRRNPGYGWHFPEALRDAQAKHESFRFRILIECGAILEPDFKLDPAWAAEMRDRHVTMMSQPWTESASIALFEMNAEFHEGICAASGNRYLREAMVRQNQIRRLYNYNWQHGWERVQVTCREHIEILDRLVAGDNEIAAALMRRHIENAGHVQPDAP